MNYALAFFLSLVLISCNGVDKNRAAVNRATALLQQQRYAEAREVLDSLPGSATQIDSVLKLKRDINQIANRGVLITNVLAIDSANKWAEVAAGTYQPQFFALASSMRWAKKPLLEMRPQIASLKQEAAVSAAANKLAIQRFEKEERENEASSKLYKRGIMAKEMREMYLDNGQDVKVKLSSKNDDELTLSFILIDEVWSHRMDKTGEIAALLDLGFKKIVLTDGYDYRRVWSRKN